MCDVTNEEQAMVAQIEREVGVIDILVNNAGIIKRIPMCKMSAEQWGVRTVPTLPFRR